MSLVIAAKCFACATGSFGEKLARITRFKPLNIRCSAEVAMIFLYILPCPAGAVPDFIDPNIPKHDSAVLVKYRGGAIHF
jgi:hypothetical protein